MMARIRTIKPDFFKHERLYDAEQSEGLPLRLAFSGLWTVADREGRFKWRPRAIKLDVLPYDDIDFSAVLDALERHGFVQRYEIEGEIYGFIPSWNKHQAVNMREAASTIPAPDQCMHVHARAEHGNARGERKGKEGKGTVKRARAHAREAPPNGGDPHPNGSRLAKNWRPNEDDVAQAHRLGMDDRQIEAAADRFRDHWIAQPGHRGVKLDWSATWRNWCRKDTESPTARRIKQADPFLI